MEQTKRPHLECGVRVLLSRAPSGTSSRGGSAGHLPSAARGQRFASVALALSLLLGACGGGGDAAPTSLSIPTPYQPATVATSERRQELVGSNGSPAAKPSEPASASGIVIAVQPRSVAVAADQAATFSVAASGTGPLQYQWQLDGVDIVGAKAATYMTRRLSLRDSDSVYSVIVSNSVQRVASAGAKLTVNPGAAVAVTAAPSITSQPRHRTALVGQTATFFVMVESSETPAYQWQRNRIPIPGANGASYTTPPVDFTDNGSRFGVVLRLGAASTTSAEALLTVTSVAGTSSN